MPVARQDLLCAAVLLLMLLLLLVFCWCRRRRLQTEIHVYVVGFVVVQMRWQIICAPRTFANNDAGTFATKTNGCGKCVCVCVLGFCLCVEDGEDIISWNCMELSFANHQSKKNTRQHFVMQEHASCRVQFSMLKYHERKILQMRYAGPSFMVRKWPHLR